MKYHSWPLVLVKPYMKPRRRRFARRDEMMREIAVLKEKEQTPEVKAAINELQGKVDHIQAQIEKGFREGAAFLPR